MKAAAVLILLFLAALAGMGWQKHQRELAEQRRDIAERAVEQTGNVLAEVRALRADVGEIEAGMKKLSEKRGTNGEQRRETIKTALDGETCAVTPVPAAVAHSLQKRAAEVRAADYSGAFTGQPDGKH
ncbi:DUF2570 domain-containing protein [Serratia marcescens]|uniref:DUF2570 domain-containing protein n=1 Tax=Serratia marcescens TaxID=615 RepID=UPI0013D97FEF|nr:DUF2570 domain-containing protein [Serratia marcescens]